MNNSEISEFSRTLIEIAWQLGPKGLNGECCENLSMPEFIALDKIAATRDCPVQMVGQALGFTKSGATKIVNRLEKKGFIKRSKSLEDGRVCCLVITDDGRQVLMKADKRYSDKFQELLLKIPQQYSAQMKDFIKAMAKALRT
ncbi:MAG: MarR family transcriptional regulator [Geobacteraceae bacterium]|nr:MarR family transcriptional regulator [Geobacteraceae bacterium]